MAGLRLYNTLTHAKQDFAPIDAENVRLYVCGPTVYDYAHIGNARPVIVFDVLFRLLRHLYGPEHVIYVRNITDVEDKITARALQTHADLPVNEAIALVTEETARVYHEDMRALGNLDPTHEPRATAYIDNPDAATDMVRLIARLIETDHAYEAEGHVLFHVPSMADYGRLARRSLDDMRAGARVEVAPYKKDPMDFVLWKPSGDRDPGWDSPWGRGRPGWHIECSAMAGALLGEVFDIHGGGIDLAFPHHENELAQSRCANDTPAMATVWMHNGFLQVEGEKMSKSLGNFFTVRELLSTRKFGSNMWHGSVLRLAMLMTHYRQPIDWTADRLVEARGTLLDWVDTASGAGSAEAPNDDFMDALCDDLNTVKALAAMHALHGKARGGSAGAARDLAASLAFLGLWNGEQASEIADHGRDTGSDPSEHDVRPLIDARNTARAARDFAEADRIRDELADIGVRLKDGPDGTTWELVR